MIQSRHIIGGGVAILTLCAVFIQPHEGVVTHAYRDPVGIWTICDGETQGVTPGERRTPAQCRAMLAQRIPDYLGPVDAMMPGLPDNRRVAYTDFAYNVGVATLRRSRIPGYEAAGNVAAACHELLRYVYAGGRKLLGLVRRRADEEKLCLNG